MRLLLLEDDDILGEALRDHLRADGHTVAWFRRIDDTRATRSEPYDALLVDWQLPDGSGLHWLHGRRAKGDYTPALILTARDRLADRIHGLDSGADDYLVKPFELDELSARLRAVCRRTAGAGVSKLVARDVTIDLQARAVYRGSLRVDLTAREWTVLEALALRAGRIVLKTELERLAHGFDADLTSNALEVHISNLRRKLGRELIETVRGLGYRVDTSAALARQ